MIYGIALSKVDIYGNKKTKTKISENPRRILNDF